MRPLPSFQPHWSGEAANMQSSVYERPLLGTTTVTVVPCPGEPANVTVPPNGRMRSRIPMSPSADGWSICLCSMPIPLSQTTMVVSEPSCFKRTMILVALSMANDVGERLLEDAKQRNPAGGLDLHLGINVFLTVKFSSAAIGHQGTPQWRPVNRHGQGAKDADPSRSVGPLRRSHQAASRWRSFYPRWFCHP